MVVVGILIVRMIVIMPGRSFAKPTVRTGMMMVCKISFSVLRAHVWAGEWETDGGLNVLE